MANFLRLLDGDGGFPSQEARAGRSGMEPAVRKPRIESATGSGPAIIWKVQHITRVCICCATIIIHGHLRLEYCFIIEVICTGIEIIRKIDALLFGLF